MIGEHPRDGKSDALHEMLKRSNRAAKAIADLIESMPWDGSKQPRVSEAAQGMLSGIIYNELTREEK
jgi:hypothetical protein